MLIKKGMQVRVISGAEKGSEGKVLFVSTKKQASEAIAKLAKELEESMKVSTIITMEIHDTTQEQLKDWGFPEAKLLPIPT